MNYQKIIFSSFEKVELQSVCYEKPLAKDEVEGRTLISLISPGTEINCNFRAKNNNPRGGGYAAVFEIERCGEEVKNYEVGDKVFCIGGHQSLQRHHINNICCIPDTLTPMRAVLARLMMVSTTTLMKTRTRAGDVAWVAGYGPVGCLAAAQFRNAGYRVAVVELDQSRRALAEADGYDVYEKCPVESTDLKGSVDIYIDCTGHEASVLDGCKMVRREGEVVLVGVPWTKRTDIDAHAILHEVFHNYVHLQSGWEWSVPRNTVDFFPQSTWRNAEKSLFWLEKEGFINEKLFGTYSPEDCQDIYEKLATQSLADIFVMFDWSLLGDK